MNQKIYIQNEINRLNGYILTVKTSSLYNDDERKEKIAKAEKEIEKQQVELAKLIEVEAETVKP